MRTFETGATCDDDTDKLDYDGFLSPLVIRRFGQYMHKHRKQPDGTLRASDNWQKGMPLDEHMKSLWRHFFETWAYHRGWGEEADIEEALCALLFRGQAYLHELLKAKRKVETDEVVDWSKPGSWRYHARCGRCKQVIHGSSREIDLHNAECRLAREGGDEMAGVV